MSAEPTVEVLQDKTELVGVVTDSFIALLAELVAQPDDVHIALTGGSVGIAVLAAINDSPERDSFPWERVHLWWGDERFVPAADPDRNELQAREALLDHLEIPAENIHGFPASDEIPDQDAAAAAYANELARYGGADQAWPTLHLTFLGVGPDGHIASLFPGFPQVLETEASVVAVQDSPKPPPLRLSMTLPVLNSSERVWLVLAGEDKAEPLRKALDGAAALDAPVSAVSGTQQTVFFADRDAASLLG